MLNRRFARIDRPGKRFLIRCLLLAVFQVAILHVAAAGPARAADESPTISGPILAQAAALDDASASRPLEPRYQPREPAEVDWYSGRYIFALSRSLADSTLAPAGKAPLFLFTVPLDIAFLPIAVIGGFFG